MEERKYTIKEVAERNGLSAKTVQRIIKDYPELGVVMEPRKKTLLTYEQAAKVSGLLAKRSQSQFERDNDPENPQKVAEPETTNNTKNVAVLDSGTDFQLVLELQSQILALTERAAKAEGQVEQLQQQVIDLKDQRSRADERLDALQADLSSTRGLLQTAEENAARAEAEANSYKPSLFGFYRKSKPAITSGS